MNNYINNNIIWGFYKKPKNYYADFFVCNGLNFPSLSRIPNGFFHPYLSEFRNKSTLKELCREESLLLTDKSSEKLSSFFQRVIHHATFPLSLASLGASKGKTVF